MNINKQITELIGKAVEKSIGPQLVKGGFKLSLEQPKQKRFGDLSTNIALSLSQGQKRPALEIARLIQTALIAELKRQKSADIFSKIEVRPPGFINLFFSQAYLYKILPQILRAGSSFGRSSLGRGQKLHIEFVSANPTGPLNVAHGRQAAFGDSLANILEFCAYKVCREYYLNDEGLQIELLGRSLYARYLALAGIVCEFPVSGYRGKYIDQLAQQLLQKYRMRLVSKGAKNMRFFSDFACRQILKGIKNDLLRFRVQFDSWFSQRSLSKSGKINRALKLLKNKGFIYQKDGAWWLATSSFGDDKDRVAIKSDSSFTYITPDIAYHQDKFKRGFTAMLNVWGPDHHGYIGRIKAVIRALDQEPERLKVLIVQLVSLSQADKIIPMSTRSGEFISLHDIIQAVGTDAARFFFLMRKRDSHLQFDLVLAKKQSLENPIFYIQYAYARIVNIIKYARSCGLIGKTRQRPKADLSLLTQPEELNLIENLRRFPETVKYCALNLEPHRIGVYLQRLAKEFHGYYEKHKVVSEDKELSRARLILLDAARIVFKNALGLLAISAPEKM